MLHVQTLDRKIWRKHAVIGYLHQCRAQDQDAVIDFAPEGSCAVNLGMYRLLDEFCEQTGYAPERITIRTGNMVEQHQHYRIEKSAQYWYEVSAIQQWLVGKNIHSDTRPSRHFANFTSRSNWARLWIATILNQHHADRTLQTYHYDPQRINYNYNGYLGLDDLVKYQCDIVPQAAEFVSTCPRTLDIEFLKTQDYTSSIYQHKNSYYPIQHPANLNLLQYYREIFVDIVVEANVAGNCFMCTEKTWRSIVARRPFITMAPFNHLHNLRRLGFKTFGDFWDESYDGVSNQHRIRSILGIIETLATMTHQELHQLLISMQDTLEHNYRTFCSLTTEQIQQEFSQ